MRTRRRVGICGRGAYQPAGTLARRACRVGRRRGPGAAGRATGAWRGERAPRELRGGGRLLRTDRADDGPVLRRRARVRRREERPRQGLRQPRRLDADRVRRPADQGPQLLGPRPAGTRARPRLPRRAYVYVLYTYDAPIWRTPRPALGHAGHDRRRLPGPAGADRRRLRGQRPALAARGAGRRHDRSRAGADRGLVPAVPEPLDRRARLRHRRRALRQRGDGASFGFADYGQERQPCQSLRRPAGRASAGTQTRPTPRAARCAARTCATGRRARRRSTARSSASTPTPAPALPDNPLRSQQRQRAADRRLRAAQPVPDHDPARAPTRSGSATSAGARWEEINRIAEPDRGASRTSAGRATRAPTARAGYDAANLNLCETLYARAAAPSRRRLHLRARGPASSPVTAARPAARRSRASPSTTAGPIRPRTTARCSSPTTRACIWAMRRARRASPTRPTSRPSSPTRRTRSTCGSARPATCSTSISTVARCAASATSPRTRRRRRWQPRARPAASPRSRSSSTAPAPPTRTRATASTTAGTSMATGSSTTRPIPSRASLTKSAPTRCG